MICEDCDATDTAPHNSDGENGNCTCGKQNAAKVYKQITSGKVETGTYLFVYVKDNTMLAFKASLGTGVDTTKNTITVTIKNGEIAYSEELENNSVIITDKNTYYSIQVNIKGTGNKVYIGATTGNKILTSTNESTYQNSITFKDDGNVTIKCGSKYLSFNTASDQMRFRYMDDKYNVQLYKLM